MVGDGDNHLLPKDDISFVALELSVRSHVFGIRIRGFSEIRVHEGAYADDEANLAVPPGRPIRI